MEIQKSSDSSRRNGWLVLGGILGLSCLLLGIHLVCFGSLAWYTGQKIVQATSTQQAAEQRTSATAVARATEISRDGILETFDTNELGWVTGKIDNEYWKGEIKLQNGQYIWDVETAKTGFLHYSMPGGLPVVTDFDISVETRLLKGDFAACSGLLFRAHPDGWEYGSGYLFSVCNDGGQFFTGFINEQGKWVKDSGWIASPVIQAGNWNRLEVSARGSRFILKINDFVVYELEEASRAEGKLALFVETHGPDENPSYSRQNKPKLALFAQIGLPAIIPPATFLFDNFTLLKH